VTGIDRNVVMIFKAKRLRSGVSPATVNKDLRQIRSALSYAMDGGIVRGNPLLRWRGLMVPEPEKAVRVVEPGEFERLLHVCCNPGFKALLIVAYQQGLRRTEVANLRWTAVDLAGRALSVVNIPEAGELTKSRRNRALPMHPDVQSVLAQLWNQAPKKVDVGQIVPTTPHVFTWPNGRPFKADWITHEFDRLVKRSGIAHCTIHDLRRSFSTLAQRAGVDRSIVKDLGGWSCIRVVERHYTGDITPALREAMEKIVARR